MLTHSFWSSFQGQVQQQSELWGGCAVATHYFKTVFTGDCSKID